MDRVSVDWSFDVSLATDGAPSIIRKKAGVLAKFREKCRLQMEDFSIGHFTLFCIRRHCVASL